MTVNNELLAAGGRDVRLFVSSTFKDMNNERDALVRRVLPALMAFASERGVRITPVDLRWGITDQQACIYLSIFQF